jgi:hypothetical protein
MLKGNLILLFQNVRYSWFSKTIFVVIIFLEFLERYIVICLGAIWLCLEVRFRVCWRWLENTNRLVYEMSVVVNGSSICIHMLTRNLWGIKNTWVKILRVASHDLLSVLQPKYTNSHSLAIIGFAMLWYIATLQPHSTLHLRFWFSFFLLFSFFFVRHIWVYCSDIGVQLLIHLK